MIDADLAFPFTLGLVAAFNPCGFAMLPVYVSFFLGKNNEDETSVARSLIRALKVGAALTAGFIAVFGIFGLLTASLLSSGSITEYSPYVTLILGVLLVPMGIAMLFFGFELKLSIPRLELGGDSGEMLSMFLFGISYAVVSLGCTVGLFIAGVSSVFTSGTFVDGVSVFIAYGLGMGAVIMTLTIALAMARNSIANNMRRVLPWVNRISGVLLVLSGIYLVIYGWWEIQVLRGNFASNGLVDFFTDFQGEVNAWINETGATRLGTALLLVIAASFIRAVWQDQSETTRYLSLGALGVAWIFAEFVQTWNGERANLFVLPILRTIVSIPERIGNWFTDPFRWGVLGELIVLALIGATVYFRLRRRQAAAGGGIAAASA
ncbi:MAG: cytochrome c biogenesis CcdA family protein [Actinomycetota bacterium]